MILYYTSFFKEVNPKKAKDQFPDIWQARLYSESVHETIAPRLSHIFYLLLTEPRSTSVHGITRRPFAVPSIFSSMTSAAFSPT